MYNCKRSLKSISFRSLIFWSYICSPIAAQSYGVLEFGTGQINNMSAPDHVIGWIFAVNEDLIVDGLGIWDDQIDGLAEEHEIGIFDSNGKLLVSTIIFSGTQSIAEGPVVAGGQWRYEMIEDLNLNAGQEYTIGARYNVDDTFESDADFVTVDDNITFIDERFSNLGSGFVFPEGTASRIGLFGPNFSIKSNSSNTCDHPRGDVNLDFVVDLLDVSPFVDLLVNGQFQCEGDVDNSGVVDLLDVVPFVDLLTGN